jgi:hypothetical protein
MASFTHFRHTTGNRSNSTSDDGSKDSKSNIRESRWIQPEQWQLPEIQEKFEKVKMTIFER